MALTQSDIENSIKSESYFQAGKKTTVCVLTLQNGFEVIGSSACVNPDDFNMETGKPYARERALNKVWELEGYRQQCA